MVKFKCGHEASGHNAMEYLTRPSKRIIRCRRCYNAMRLRRYYRLKKERQLDMVMKTGPLVDPPRTGDGKFAVFVCVNAHDRCYEGGPCPYCEPKVQSIAQHDMDARCARIAT